MPREIEAWVAPDVPGVARLGWMLFMQPIRLHRMFAAWGLERDPSLWRLRLRLRARDPVALALVYRLAWLLGAVMPAATFGIGVVLVIAGVDVKWPIMAIGVVFGVGFGLTVSMGFGVAGGVVFGILVGVASGVAGSMVGGIAGGMVGGVAFGVAGSMAVGVAFGLAFGVAGSMAVGVAFGLAFGVAGSIAAGVLVGGPFSVAKGIAIGAAKNVAGDMTRSVVVGVAFIAFFYRLPFYCIELLWTLLTSAAVRAHPAAAPRMAPWLPFRHHDLIRFPLPGLERFLLVLADQDPALATSLLDEAASTLAQKTPARRALAELQGRSLERAARERLWARAGALDLPFLPRPDDVDDASPFSRFRKAGQDLHAARLATDHLRRRHALERARAALESYRITLVGLPRPGDLERRLDPTTRLWLDVLADELRALAEDERARPQIPTPFEPGPPLRAEDTHLFKGRADLIRLIDHDLADHRRAPLLLTGQRRMGKTSLLHMLPERLGTGTTVVSLNFQALSGSPHRAEPHRWLAEALCAAHPALPAPPATAAWGDTLAWLCDADAALAGHSVLLAIDEIERLQTGIDEGWTTPAFLDFLRAAGDSLRRIRLLLVSAHPLHRLGRAWTDRLISVVHREITYLTSEEAEDLIRNPMPGFPDMYPLGGVARLVRETRGHPYLIQLVCDALVRDLNGRGRLTAEDADLTRALDRALGDTPLFRELWADRTDEERALLRALAAADAPAGEPSSALKELVHAGHVEIAEGRPHLAVPLFRDWIRERA